MSIYSMHNFNKIIKRIKGKKCITCVQKICPNMGKNINACGDYTENKMFIKTMEDIS